MLSEPLMRDLAAARDAYSKGSVDASRAAHQQGGQAHESHLEAGGRIKSIVFGGLDGILTSFAIIAGAVGAHIGTSGLLAMGVSNVLADALSMSVGEFLSTRSYNKYVRKELERETWELDNYPEGEVQEMVALFESRGMSHMDATTVISIMAKYKTFFLNIMMTEELALPVPDDDDNAESLKEAAAMFIAFSGFGMLPIMGFVIVPLIVPGLDDHTLFLCACAITGFALFGLGAFKAHFSDKRHLWSGVETVLLGGCCAAIAFMLGRLVDSFWREGSGALRHML
ncbi:hypothetical protein AB1Y20_013678 [Prymnesium parvum]|uniref:Vacuolar iron transporter 1 n=1 Tax=Prymnesium parvum TaxID=97485 RepID=A0AB34IIW5_PRYPA|mmetsp:Transcript_28905/g.43608  ORF Transcript_28905/g.43608 Transcript_28905/m.43608 type:complete len:284 (-) Transcript_28905:657-1508(-)